MSLKKGLSPLPLYLTRQKKARVESRESDTHSRFSSDFDDDDEEYVRDVGGEKRDRCREPSSFVVVVNVAQ